MKYKKGLSPVDVQGVLARHQVTKLGEIPGIRALKLAVPAGKEQEYISLLSHDPNIEYAELNYLVSYDFIPNDPLYPIYQWNLTKIGMPTTWDITLGDPTVMVAVLDTGIDYTHPDRPAHLVLGPDFGGNDLDPFDADGHGTHVVGIIAAATNNGTGVASVAPGITILVVKVFPDLGLANDFDIATAVQYSTDQGAKVLNMSLGGAFYSQVLTDAVDYALGRGRIVVAAAGNSFTEGNPIMYPAALPGVIAVAATGPNDEHAPYSEEGDWISLAAPGGVSNATGSGIMSTVPYYYPDYYRILVGTSMAAPHVSALAALIWSVYAQAPAYQVKSIMENTAVDIGLPGKDPVFGYGRIDAAAAVQRAVAIQKYSLYLPLVTNEFAGKAGGPSAASRAASSLGSGDPVYGEQTVRLDH